MKVRRVLVLPFLALTGVLAAVGLVACATTPGQTAAYLTCTAVAAAANQQTGYQLVQCNAPPATGGQNASPPAQPQATTAGGENACFACVEASSCYQATLDCAQDGACFCLLQCESEHNTEAKCADACKTSPSADLDGAVSCILNHCPEQCPGFAP
jgi:hypothetical protein